MSYDRSTNSRLTVARRSADRRPTHCMLPDREMQSADGRPIIGRRSAEWKTLWSVKVIGEVCF